MDDLLQLLTGGGRISASIWIIMDQSNDGSPIQRATLNSEHYIEEMNVTVAHRGARFHGSRLT